MTQEIALYLAGPMTGLPDLNYPAFEAAATSLRGLGYRVLSPHELGIDAAKQKEIGWAQALKRSLRQMLETDAVAYLHGFQESSGAKLEIMVADRLSMPCHPIAFWELNHDRYVTPVPGC